MVECPIVETGLGKVKGKVVNVEGGRDVFRYSSLPFAKPPVGELRFEPPVKPEAWSGVLDGSKQSASPLQDTTDADKMDEYFPDEKMCIRKIDEDCLYLSVYTTSTNKKTKLPVLLWIYGGEFVMGGEYSYDGSILASLNDVVVVIPNYRVSVFGFLSLGRDSPIPGNMGMMDQLMAMKWTREHINNFGGDPNNVTIFGESSGSMAVNYHMASPLSRDYFDKAISHSGTIHMGDFVQESDGYTLSLFLKELKIKEEDPQKIAKLLKTLPVKNILKADRTLLQQMIYFMPTVDGKFLVKNREEMSKDNFHSKPYIVGCTNSEGCGLLSTQQYPNFNEGISKKDCLKSISELIGYLFFKSLPDSAYELIIKEYSKGVPDDKKKWSKIYGDVSGDIMFVNPAIQTLNQHKRNQSKTYMYVMTQTPKYNHDDKYGPKKARKASFCKCDHGDDLLFTFGLPLCKGKTSRFTDEERELSKEWMKYLANFAKTGDPSSGKSVKVTWPQYDAKEQSYLSVQQPCSIGKKFQANRVKFLEETIFSMMISSK